MYEENTGQYWPDFGGTDSPCEYDAGALNGPHWSYIGASCGPSCGTGEAGDIYEAAVREAEDAAYEEWLEYRHAQQKKEAKASGHNIRPTSQKGIRP